MSDNPFSAENQQERLITIGWIIGFVDGEGCFSIGFIHQKDGKNRKGYKIGYQISHEFAVTQGAKSIDALHALRTFFGVGQVIINKRYDNHKEHLYRYVVRKRKDLLEVIIPFFQQYSMRSAKQYDFEKFARCVAMMQENLHINSEGALEIAHIVQTMNRQKSKHDVIRILRDHTSNIQDIG
jgi:hypothetical protein